VAYCFLVPADSTLKEIKPNTPSFVDNKMPVPGSNTIEAELSSPKTGQVSFIMPTQAPDPQAMLTVKMPVSPLRISDTTPEGRLEAYEQPQPLVNAACLVIHPIDNYRLEEDDMDDTDVNETMTEASYAKKYTL
jgi:hypothetical protein